MTSARIIRWSFIPSWNNLTETWTFRKTWSGELKLSASCPKLVLKWSHSTQFWESPTEKSGCCWELASVGRSNALFFFHYPLSCQDTSFVDRAERNNSFGCSKTVCCNETYRFLLPLHPVLFSIFSWQSTTCCVVSTVPTRTTVQSLYLVPYWRSLGPQQRLTLGTRPQEKTPNNKQTVWFPLSTTLLERGGSKPGDREHTGQELRLCLLGVATSGGTRNTRREFVTAQNPWRRSGNVQKRKTKATESQTTVAGQTTFLLATKQFWDN